MIRVFSRQKISDDIKEAVGLAHDFNNYDISINIKGLELYVILPAGKLQLKK